jgi:hypothetical protein
MAFVMELSLINWHFDMEIDEIFLMCEDVACCAIEGCPSKTYNKLSILMDMVVSVFPLLDESFPLIFKQILESLVSFQSNNDLNRIADCVNFELPSLIEEHKKK